MIGVQNSKTERKKDNFDVAFITSYKIISQLSWKLYLLENMTQPTPIHVALADLR